MDKILPELQREYCRWKKILEHEPYYYGDHYISIDDALRSHYLICDYFAREGERVAVIGPKDINLLISAINRQFTSIGRIDKWNTPLEKAATVFYGLNKNHAFHDGNKRTALLVTLYAIIKANRTPRVKEVAWEEMSVRTAANELYKYIYFKDLRKKHGEHDARVYLISKLLGKFTREFDSRFYRVTFNQLDTILRRYNHKLDHPDGNYINLYRMEEKTKGIIRKQKVVEDVYIAQVGFPGGTKEVTVNAMRTIRKKAGLTAENGIDSQVFFKDIDRISVLITRFHGPLYRLKDK